MKIIAPNQGTPTGGAPQVRWQDGSRRHVGWELQFLSKEAERSSRPTPCHLSVRVWSSGGQEQRLQLPLTGRRKTTGGLKGSSQGDTLEGWAPQKTPHNTASTKQQVQSLSDAVRWGTNHCAMSECLCPPPQDGGITRWGFWEVIKSWGWNGIHALTEETAERGHREKTMNQEVGSHQWESADTLILDLQPPKLWESEFLLSHQPVVFCYSTLNGLRQLGRLPWVIRKFQGHRISLHDNSSSSRCSEPHKNRYR